MSEFLAEAKVLVRPDTTGFRAQLAAQLNAIKAAPIVVPVVAAGAGTQTVARSLSTLEASTLRAAGAQRVLDNATKKSTASLLGAGSASQKLDAGLLGLRSAIGGSAVIGLGALALGAIAAGKAIRATIDITAQFETEMNTFRAVAGATADEMERVSERAKELGADVRLPAVSAADAAIAMTELAKAGLDVEEAMVGAEGVLQLATAAQISNADAAQITANVLNSFGLAGDQAVRVADALANAANAAQGSITDFGLAMRQVSAVSEQVGVSMADTTAILALLAKNGLQGSDAGTSLRVALLRLVAPTKKASELINSLNLDVRDLQGNVRADVFAQFARATAALGPELRDAAAAAVFGQDAIRAVAIAGREGAAGLRLMRFEIDQQGTASALAAARTEGLAGSFSNLQNVSSNTGLTIGKVFSPALQGLVDVAAFTVKGIDEIVVSIGRLHEATKFELPGDSFVKGLFKDFTLIPVTIISKAQEEIKGLTERMLLLQQARVVAQDAGKPKIANELTVQIQALRKEIHQLKIEAGEVVPPQTAAEKQIAKLRRAWTSVKEARDKASDKGRDTSALDQVLSDLQVSMNNVDFGSLAKNAKTSFADLATSIKASLAVLEIDPTGELANKALANVRSLVKKVESAVPVSGAAGNKIGLALVRAIQEAITTAAQAGNVGAAKALKALADRLAAGFEGDLQGAFKGIKIPLLGDEISEALQPSGVAVARAGAVGTSTTQIQALEDRKKVVEELIAAGRATGAELEGLFNELTSIDDRVQGIEDGIASEIQASIDKRRQAIEDNKKKIEDAQRKLEEDFFAMLDAALRPIKRLQTQALGTEPLGDDIKFRGQLIALYTKQIAQIRKVLGDTKVARTAMKAIQDLILDEVNKLKAEQRNYRKQLADALKERQAKLIERAQLDVEFASINENVKAEIAARRRLIAQYKKAQQAAKGNINEVKRYRNLIAEEQAAIEELAGQKKDSGDAFKELAFAFLQKQQGFAANLLGNLIPGSAAGGLVGASQAATPTPPPGPDLGPLAGAKAARDQGVTPGSFSQLIGIQKAMLDVMERIAAGNAHPETKYQRVSSGASMDFQGGV